MFFENSSLPKFLTIIFEIVFHELYNSLEFFDIQRRCQVLQIFILQLCQTPFQRFQRTCLSDETKQCFYKIIVFFIANHPSRRRVILDDWKELAKTAVYSGVSSWTIRDFAHVFIQRIQPLQTLVKLICFTCAQIEFHPISDFDRATRNLHHWPVVIARKGGIVFPFLFI